MVIVDYRGPEEPRYARITSRADLADCIIWLLAVLDEMELKGKDADTIVDLKDCYGDGI